MKKVVLNLGCGKKWSSHPNVTNIDWHIYLRIKRNPVYRFLANFLLGEKRNRVIDSLKGNYIVHDLSKGIPFDDHTVDVVYHSHLLEHLDRDVAKIFIKECFRVIKPGGMIRIAVPDLEAGIRSYVKSLHDVDRGVKKADAHDQSIDRILGQSVIREAQGSSLQNKFLRKLENLLLGDARKRGQTHQWMYDRVNLSSLLQECGFGSVCRMSLDTSKDEEWNSYFLDQDEEGNEHKVGSLYVEGEKKV